MRADGSEIEGQVFSVGDADFFVLDNATGQSVHVHAHELTALDVSVPRRGREWMVAAAAIPVAVAALVAYARVPDVLDGRFGGILTGFMILVVLGTGVVSTPVLRKWLQSRLATWQRIYPPT